MAASEPRGIARDRLLLLLWPESTTDRARGALYQLLYVVRQSLGEDSVVGSDELRLATHVVSSDVADFTAAIARDDLAAAVELYGGPFLDAVHVSGAPELERWVEQKRQELARAYQSALYRLGSQAMEQRDFPAAVSLAERLIDADPLSDRATVLLMEALAASGDVTAALERARTHAALVKQELGAEVDASVSSLVTRLRTSGGTQPFASKQEESAHAARSPAADKELALESASTKPVVPARRRNRAIALATAAVVVIAVAGIVAMRWPRAHAPEFAVVADFETPPADGQIAEILTDATRRALSDSRSLVAAQENQVRDARRRVHVPATEKLDVALARKLALGAGIRTVVRSSLTSFAGGYAISLRLISAPTGQVLATAERTGIAPRQILVVLDTLTRELREHAGYDLELIRAQPSLLALTSTSLEAMSDYVAALRLPPDSGVQAVRLLRAAVERDSSFASAIWQLARLLERVGGAGDEERRALLARAWAHREGLTEYELPRLEIAYLYSPNGKAPDVIEHVKRLRQLVERFPNAEDAKILADFYNGNYQLAEAESTYRLEIALDSTRLDGFANLIFVNLRAKRVPQARRALDLFTQKFPNSSSVDVFGAVVAYAEGDRAKARTLLEKGKALTDNRRDLGYVNVAELDLLEGRPADFYRGFRVADSLRAARLEGATLSPLALRLQVSAAYWVRNRADEGLMMLEAALLANPNLRHSLEAVELYAQLGRPDSARALLAARGLMDRTIYAHGTDTLAASGWIEMAEGRPREAARKFRESLRFSGGTSRIDRDPDIGLAFERAGMPDSAIAVYEHYLNRTTGWEQDAFKLVWILEHVAPLYERKGDRAKAKAAYGRIAELWKDPDPELRPRAAHARERLAALR